MNYHSYDYLSALTEERLASIICEGVKDYLSEVTDYVARCQARDAQQQEIIDVLEAKNNALQRQVDELKQCLATCHAMSSRAMTFGGAVSHSLAFAVTWFKSF